MNADLSEIQRIKKKAKCFLAKQLWDGKEQRKKEARWDFISTLYLVSGRIFQPDTEQRHLHPSRCGKLVC